MEKLIIRTHSFVDVITNSSSEIYSLDTDKSFEFVKNAIRDLEKKYPTEYNYHINVRLEDENYEDQCYYGESTINEYVDVLKRNGYSVEKIENWEPKQIIIVSCERGCMNRTLIDIIKKDFNATYISD